jgi:ribosomal protein S12 methylthiotransferase accessory factor
MPETLDSPFTPVADALARLEEAVSPLTGIVRELSPTMWAADEPRLHAFACALASSAVTTGYPTTAYSGSGHVERERALAASVGEAVERYAATYAPAELMVARASELDEAVPPSSFALFHERQFVPGFPFARFDEATRIAWARGFSLLDGRPVLLPAQLVYLCAFPGEPPIGYPTSNGLACGPTLVEAILAGLLELVERDAMIIVWSNRLHLPRLRWRDDPGIEPVDARVFRPTGLRYVAIDTSAFFDVPATIGVVHGAPGERAALAVGAGCARSIADAWRTCLAEAFSVHRWLRGLLHEHPRTGVARTEDVTTLEDHMVFYGTPERAGDAWLLEAADDERDTRDVPALPGDTPGEILSEIVSRLTARGVSAYAADVTSPDVEELGLKVARVIAPELCALDVLGRAPYRGGERRYRAAFESGVLDRPLAYEELNPLPHPYP